MNIFEIFSNVSIFQSDEKNKKQLQRVEGDTSKDVEQNIKSDRLHEQNSKETKEVEHDTTSKTIHEDETASKDETPHNLPVDPNTSSKPTAIVKPVKTVDIKEKTEEPVQENKSPPEALKEKDVESSAVKTKPIEPEPSSPPSKVPEPVKEEPEEVPEPEPVISQQMLDDISQQIHGLEDELRKCQDQITGVEVRNEQMIIVVDEFERTVQGIIKEKDKENVPLLIQKEKVARERDLVVSDLENVERAFSDLNNKYERAVGVVSSFAEEEEQLKSTLEDLTTRLSASEEKYETKKKDAEKQLQE